MLCKGCYIFNEIKGKTIIFYINRSGVPYFDISNSVAYVIAYISNDAVNIGSFYAHEKGTRQGTFILKALCEFIEQRFPEIQKVELDDSTGVNPPKNIYYRLGFKVRDEKTHRFINWDTWLERYKHLSNPSEERRIPLRLLLKNLESFLE